MLKTVTHCNICGIHKKEKKKKKKKIASCFFCLISYFDVPCTVPNPLRSYPYIYRFIILMMS